MHTHTPTTLIHTLTQKHSNQRQEMVNYVKSFRKQLIACHLITLPVLSQFQMPHYISIRKDDLCLCSLSFFESLVLIVYGSGLCLCVCVRVCVCVCVCASLRVCVLE